MRERWFALALLALGCSKEHGVSPDSGSSPRTGLGSAAAPGAPTAGSESPTGLGAASGAPTAGSESPTGLGAASPSGSTSAPPPAPPPALTRLGSTPPSAPPCRILAGTKLVGQPVTGFLTLATGDTIVVRQPTTARELTFLGPAEVSPCETDGAWLRRGRFQSTLGAGDTPGAQQWIVTPHAVVAYGSSRIAVDVGDRATRVEVTSGHATLYGLDDTTRTVTPGSPVVASPPDAGTASDAAKACAEARERLAAATSDHPSPDDLARSVTAHRAARIACAIAALLGSERR